MLIMANLNQRGFLTRAANQLPQTSQRSKTTMTFTQDIWVILTGVMTALGILWIILTMLQL